MRQNCHFRVLYSVFLSECHQALKTCSGLIFLRECNGCFKAVEIQYYIVIFKDLCNQGDNFTEVKSLKYTHSGISPSGLKLCCQLLFISMVTISVLCDIEKFQKHKSYLQMSRRQPMDHNIDMGPIRNRALGYFADALRTQIIILPTQLTAIKVKRKQNLPFFGSL